MRWLARVGIGLLVIVLALGLVYFLGPRPYPDEPLQPSYEALDVPLSNLTAFVAAQEAAVTDLKDNNHARFLWADSTQKTPWSIVYLHGFSAGPMEGDPIVWELTASYQCNAYIPRLADHGRSTKESFRDLTPEDLLESAHQALQIGKKIGERVLVIGSSTGASIGMYLSTQFPELVDAFVVYSPNLQLANANASYITGPWGCQIAESLVGSEYRRVRYISEISEQYWTRHYHINGLITLQRLLEATTQPPGWEKEFDLPVLIGYYYKDDTEKDEVVSIPRIQAFYTNVQTPADQKRIVAFANVGSHVMHSPVESTDVPAVYQETLRFLEEVLDWEED